MTADNSQWDYGKLRDGIALLEEEKSKIRISPLIRSVRDWQCRNIDHVIEFIEWNMEQLEITDNNGD